jgi:histone-lysine N-methyltransferase NSD2
VSSKLFKGMNFTKTARELISKDKDWKENTRPLANCEENCSIQIECDNYCQGGEGCSNKCIQKGEVKNVRKGQRGEKGFGLFAGEDIQEGEYVIKYIGKITSNDPNNEYTMMYKEFNLWVNASKSDTLAKFINHSCNPHCVNKMRAVKGMPRLCFFANRDILKGEEITFSYSWTLLAVDSDQGLETVCLCRDDSCIRTIEKVDI